VADYVSLYEEALAESGDVCVSIGDATESLARKVGWLESLLHSAGEPFAMPPLPLHAIANIRLRLPDTFRRMPAGAATQISVEIENRSAEVLASVAPYPVHLSYHWLESGTGRYHVFDGERTALIVAVRPRSRLSQEMRILAPQEPGQYVLVLTMVQESLVWFDQTPQPVAGRVAGHRPFGRLRTARREDAPGGGIVDVRSAGAGRRVRKPGIRFRPQGSDADVRGSPPVRRRGPGLSADFVHIYNAGVG